MTWFTVVLVYVIVWWVVFFMALPVGARSYYEAGEKTETGFAESTPMRPRLWLKAGITTAIAAVVTALVWYLVVSGAISFRP